MSTAASTEESYYAEKPEFRAAEAAWLTIIPCKWGHIYPHGGQTLAAYCGRRKSKRVQLASLDCVEVYVDGDHEVSVLFDVADFALVAAVMEPKRRRRMSPEQRAASIERLREYQCRPGESVQQKFLARQSDSGHPERVPTVPDGEIPVQAG